MKDEILGIKIKENGSSPDGTKFLRIIKSNWAVVILTGLVYVSAFYFSTGFRLNQVEKDVSNSKQYQEKTSNDISEMKGDIKSIKTALEYIAKR